MELRRAVGSPPPPLQTPIVRAAKYVVRPASRGVITVVGRAVVRADASMPVVLRGRSMAVSYTHL